MISGTGPAGRLAAFFIESKLTPLLVAAALAVGVFSVTQTPREEEPQIVLPVFDVFVTLPGAGIAEVERRVTIPLEKRLWEIAGVEYVYAVSMPGASMVTVRFHVGEDMERSLVKVYQKLVSGMDAMPAEASPPLVRRRVIDDVPVLALTLWSDRTPPRRLRTLALELRTELASLPDVAGIEVIGGRRRTLRVIPDLDALAGVGMGIEDLERALRTQNRATRAGSDPVGNREVVLESGGFLAEPADVEALVVGVAGDGPVYLRQVARVVDGEDEPESHVFFVPGAAFGEAAATDPPDPEDAYPAVTLAVAKRAGSDATRVVEAVLERLEQVRPGWIPADVHVTVTRDYGHTADEKARELLTHLVGAIVSVTLVLALFLGWRGGLVVFISVPVTFALTLFIYYLFGYTLNRVTLFALIFVTGIVVDDSIIVVENIVRHFAMRAKKPLQAAVEAVDEVGNPTILATLTVIAAVLPMAFVRGLMGPYMRPMPVGATLAMTFSLLVALVIAPWFAYRLLRNHRHEAGEPYAVERTAAYRVARSALVPLMRRPALAWAFIGGVAALLLLSLLLFPLRLVTVKMLPFDNKSELQVIVDMPEGTTLETTLAAARDLADTLRREPEVTDVEIYAGTAAPVNFNGLVRHYDLRRGSHVADLQVNFLPKHRRDVQSHDLARRIRPRVEAVAARHGAAVKIAEVPPGPPVLSTLVAEVYAPDDARRRALAAQVLEVFRSTDGVVDTDWLVEAPQPKRIVRLNRARAVRAGVDPGLAVAALHAALAGTVAGRLHDPHHPEPVPVEIRLDLAERVDEDLLASLRVPSRTGARVPLRELVQVEETTEAPFRYRKNLRPVIYVVGDVAGREESPVYAMLNMADRVRALPAGGDDGVTLLYRGAPSDPWATAVKWDGEWQITYEVFRDLGSAFGVVLVLIYMLIIGWFRSFKVPLVMMIAIPLSLVGILPGHWMLGAFFTATSMIGFIALAGIMVRNSVLLIDFIELSLERGRSLAEAVVEAGAVRFRPILLTAGTVVVGAVVILFDPIFEGLAISLMFGAAASTALTLGVVPLVYYMVERKRHPRPLPESWAPAKPQGEAS